MADHPLPWRWENWERLIDAKGDPLIEVTDEPVVDDADEGPHSPTVLFANSYVRAVTERAGAMEQELRWLTTLLFEAKTLLDMMYPDHGARLKMTMALLAEIDAAKTSAASSPALVSRCVLDEHTCPTCFAADGSPATSTPACEHLAKGTGMCRCVLVPATKAGG